MQILIAEDDLTSRLVLKAVLEKQGHDVLATEDGLAAWEIMRKPDAPLLAVLDWRMPGLDGLELCRKLRALDTDRRPYLIMLTSLGDKKHIVEALDAGADDYVVKPFEHAELQARIAAAARVIELQERLTTLAMTDELTGLANRRAGLEALQKEVARAARQGTSVGVGIMDVDHFKTINDTHGHAVGDDALCQLAVRARTTLRPYDVVSRHGGEEFLLVVAGATDESPWDRLLHAINSEPLETREGELDVTVSIGFICEAGVHDPDALLEAADRALYRAKESGRNQAVQGNVGEIEEIATAPSSPPQRDLGEQDVDRRIVVGAGDNASRRSLAAQLEGLGYIAEQVSNGDEAWTALRDENGPRLAILDSALPGLAGMELGARTKACRPSLPPYIITLAPGSGGPTLQSRLTTDADDYLLKPFDHGRLAARITIGQRILSARQEARSTADALARALSRIDELEQGQKQAGQCA